MPMISALPSPSPLPKTMPVMDNQVNPKGLKQASNHERNKIKYTKDKAEFYIDEIKKVVAAQGQIKMTHNIPVSNTQASVASLDNDTVVSASPKGKKKREWWFYFKYLTNFSYNILDIALTIVAGIYAEQAVVGMLWVVIVLATCRFIDKSASILKFFSEDQKKVWQENTMIWMTPAMMAYVLVASGVVISCVSTYFTKMSQMVSLGSQMLLQQHLVYLFALFLALWTVINSMTIARQTIAFFGWTIRKTFVDKKQRLKYLRAKRAKADNTQAFKPGVIPLDVLVGNNIDEDTSNERERQDKDCVDKVYLRNRIEFAGEAGKTGVRLELDFKKVSVSCDPEKRGTAGSVFIKGFEEGQFFIKEKNNFKNDPRERSVYYLSVSEIRKLGLEKEEENFVTGKINERQIAMAYLKTKIKKKTIEQKKDTASEIEKKSVGIRGHIFGVLLSIILASALFTANLYLPTGLAFTHAVWFLPLTISLGVLFLATPWVLKAMQPWRQKSEENKEVAQLKLELSALEQQQKAAELTQQKLQVQPAGYLDQAIAIKVTKYSEYVDLENKTALPIYVKALNNGVKGLLSKAVDRYSWQMFAGIVGCVFDVVITIAAGMWSFPHLIGLIVPIALFGFIETALYIHAFYKGDEYKEKYWRKNCKPQKCLGKNVQIGVGVVTLISCLAKFLNKFAPTYAVALGIGLPHHAAVIFGALMGIVCVMRNLTNAEKSIRFFGFWMRLKGWCCEPPIKEDIAVATSKQQPELAQRLQVGAVNKDADVVKKYASSLSDEETPRNIVVVVGG